jgi:hypothetical protein
LVWYSGIITVHHPNPCNNHHHYIYVDQNFISAQPKGFGVELGQYSDQFHDEIKIRKAETTISPYLHRVEHMNCHMEGNKGKNESK